VEEKLQHFQSLRALFHGLSQFQSHLLLGALCNLFYFSKDGLMSHLPLRFLKLRIPVSLSNRFVFDKIDPLEQEVV